MKRVGLGSSFLTIRRRGVGTTQLRRGSCAPCDLCPSLTKTPSRCQTFLLVVIADVLLRLFRARVQSGKRPIKASNYPMFLYDESKYNPDDVYSGLFQGPLLLKFYRHVFTGPSSWKTGTSTRGKLPRGIINKLKAPTPQTIAYIAMMVRFSSLIDRH